MTELNRRGCGGRRGLLVLVAAVALPSLALAQENTKSPLLGRWDLHVTDKGGTVYPSWLEVIASGNSALVGRFVGRVGSARPVSDIHYDNGVATFSIPPQWESGTANLQFEGRWDDGKVSGTITLPDGEKDAFTGVRAPAMLHAAPKWGTPIRLFNGRDLTGWTTEGGTSHWSAANGILRSAESGANIMTTRKFGDFKLHIEFRYPKDGNSGVYLRGRHEVQVEDSPKRDIPISEDIGGVYGFLWPNENAALGPNKWQTYDITLIGRRVTVVLNGHTVIANQIIPGPTGGALDSDEGMPGPILLQGDHRPIEYRNIVITPGKS